ncbi:hypothetical protein P12x_000959 [Tundrisphaera lichenicola]|uniref:hypothetical protein n=1 Tax=Tundrisphaera lichenicola TaxID=2029860 RepID=UPI003EB8FA6E
MSTDSTSNPPEIPANPHRLFLHEPGWRVAQKVGSEREFCYAMAPGQDYYHRLLDGEIYIFNNEERLCLACAERRQMLADKPKGLRDPVPIIEIDDGSEEGPGVYLREKADPNP